MKFIPIYFFIALFVGFLVVYILAPTPNVVVKYPNLDTPDDTTYIDDSGVCYRYNKQRIQCPSNKDAKIIDA
jgi:hypothetical protein